MPGLLLWWDLLVGEGAGIDGLVDGGGGFVGDGLPGDLLELGGDGGGDA